MANFGGSNQTSEKTFPCLTCKQEIRLQRNADNSGWLRFNLDGSPHIDAKKSFPSSKTADSISKLESKIDQLIKEVQELKIELKK